MSSHTEQQAPPGSLSATRDLNLSAGALAIPGTTAGGGGGGTSSGAQSPSFAPSSGLTGTSGGSLHQQQQATSPAKNSLTAWWKQFTGKQPNSGKNKDVQKGIFGVPLEESIKYAYVAISVTNKDGESYIYGYIPIVVAKCGVFLKEKGTDIEGVFRVSGSAKRINELQAIFDSPPKFGKGLVWDGFNVHDAANILRRYLRELPQPIIPYEFYFQFRDALPSTPADIGRSINIFCDLIARLPILNRQLLLYILDLLAVFDAKSDINLMPASNLAAIFQPGIITHPDHDMLPQEYVLSQEVVIFLISHQNEFLFDLDQPLQHSAATATFSITSASSTSLPSTAGGHGEPPISPGLPRPEYPTSSSRGHSPSGEIGSAHAPTFQHHFSTSQHRRSGREKESQQQSNKGNVRRHVSSRSRTSSGGERSHRSPYGDQGQFDDPPQDASRYADNGGDTSSSPNLSRRNTMPHVKPSSTKGRGNGEGGNGSRYGSNNHSSAYTQDHTARLQV